MVLRGLKTIKFIFYSTPKGLDKSSESQTKDKEDKSSLGEIQTTPVEFMGNLMHLGE